MKSFRALWVQRIRINNQEAKQETLHLVLRRLIQLGTGSSGLLGPLHRQIRRPRCRKIRLCSNRPSNLLEDHRFNRRINLD